MRRNLLSSVVFRVDICEIQRFVRPASLNSSLASSWETAKENGNITMKGATAAALAVALVLVTSRRQAAGFSLPDLRAAESSSLPSGTTQNPPLVNSGTQRNFHLPGGNATSNTTGPLAKECGEPPCNVRQTTCECEGFCEFASSRNPCTCTKRWYCTLIETAFLGQNSTDVGTRTSSDDARPHSSNQTRTAQSPSDN